MAKVKWSKVKRGDVVEAGGIAWTVEKIKTKGTHAKVTIRNGSRVAESKVSLADKVKLAPAEAAPSKPSKPKRPAKKPPAPAHGDPWETQQDRVERKLDEILGAKLVGEGDSRGFYVPVCDVTTIASHLLIFHGGIPEAARGNEEAMLVGHLAEHQLALDGRVDLKVNHWHTEKRPTSGKKKSKKK